MGCCWVSHTRSLKPSRNVPFQQPLCIYTERAPPQQMFRTQRSGLHGRTSKPNHLERKTAKDLRAISLLCRTSCLASLIPKSQGRIREERSGAPGPGSGGECQGRRCSWHGCSCCCETRRRGEARHGAHLEQAMPGAGSSGARRAHGAGAPSSFLFIPASSHLAEEPCHSVSLLARGQVAWLRLLSMRVSPSRLAQEQ